jgi:hypothetical protein
MTLRETRGCGKRGEDSVFGHKWESARGTVVETLIEQTTVDGMPGLHQVPVYVLDVRKPSGEHVRAQVTGVPGMSTDLAAGTLVSVEVNAKTGELRFSPDHIKASLAAARNTTQVRVDTTSRVTTTVTGGQPGMPGGAGMPGAGMPGIHMVGGEQAAELMQAVQALRAGGGDREAAREKIRQLKAELQVQSGGVRDQVFGIQGAAGGLQAQADVLHNLAERLQAQADRLGQGGQAGPGGSVGFSSPDAPSTFDPVTPGTPGMPAATFSSPADVFGPPTSSVGEPGGSVSFSSPPVPPPSFDPVSPSDTRAGSFSAGSFSAGSFSTGSFSSFGEDGKASRIARLAEQRDHGQLTEQQFQAQRQQIMDEI